MRSFFNPAIFVMERLSYTRKFALLGLVSFVAFAVVVGSLYESLRQTTYMASRELEGIKTVEQFTKAIQLIQKHRGLSTAILNNSKLAANFGTPRANTEKMVDDAFDRLDGLLPPNMKTAKDYLNLKEAWVSIRQNWLYFGRTSNFSAHTALVERMQLYELAVADEYMLSLDADLSTTAMIDAAINKIPDALEHLGRIRAFGVGVLANGWITEQQKMEMVSNIAQLKDALPPLKAGLEKVGQYNPETQARIAVKFSDIIGSAQRTILLVESDIIPGRFLTSPQDYIKMLTEEIDRGYEQIYGSILPATEELIKARIVRAENILYASIGVATLLFLVVIYFSVGIYYATINSIQSLAESARAFAAGNLHARIKLSTRDELEQIGRSFNKMADGFNTMLDAQSENEARFRATIETSMDAVVSMNSEGFVTGWSGQAEHIFGWPSAEVIGRQLHETIIPVRYREAHISGLSRFLLTGRSAILNVRIEVVGVHRDGHEFPIELSVTSFMMNGKHEFSAFIHDISERKEAESNIYRLAFYDTLTHLPNRRLLLDRLQHALAARSHNGALMFIDLDNFKLINDTRGHNYGDLLLVEVAQRLQACVREGDTVGRLGGDEFVVILENIVGDVEHTVKHVEEVGGKILASISQPYTIMGYCLHSAASIGVILFTNHDSSAEELLKYADIAMYQAKATGRNTLRFFDPKMQAILEDHATLEADLRQALAASQFTLYYQAQADDAGRIISAEALIRWNHPERGMILPQQFIPIAEEGSLIIDIGQWVIETACQQLALWNDVELKRDLILAVNVSAKQFKLNCFVERVAEMIERYHINPSRLKLELTESVVMEDKNGIADKMHQLKTIGVKLSLDDFGTGYSSLSCLKELPLDQLKIDRSFIRDVTTNPIDAMMVQTIINIAHNFRMNAIAEGVESQAQMDFLKKNGCLSYQGYLISKPLPIAEFEALFIQETATCS